MRTGLAVLIVSCSVILRRAQEQARSPGRFSGAAADGRRLRNRLGRTGRLIPDLTQDDFEVYDNGKKQEITLFESGSSRSRS
jgi:hypothetical protein